MPTNSFPEEAKSLELFHAKETWIDEGAVMIKIFSFGFIFFNQFKFFKLA